MISKIDMFITCLLSLALNKQHVESQKKASGDLYVLKCSTKLPKTDKLTKLLPDDSIFLIHDFHAIEKNIGYEDLDFYGKFTRTEIVSSIYYLDFKTNKCAELQFKTRVNPLGQPLKPIAVKTTGFNISFVYYNGETFLKTDTIINNHKLTKISYESIKGDNGLKHAKLQVLLDMSTAAKRQPSFFPSIEDKFGGKVCEIMATYPNNQGTVYLIIERKKQYSSEYFDTIEKLEAIYE